MFEWLFSWGFWGEHALILMFFSAFLSATVLPGNSEVVFVSLASPIFLQNNYYFSPALCYLLMSATIGNSLGSMTTYWLGKIFPPLKKIHSARGEWVIQQIQRYGVAILLLSWLPIIGDLLCVMAGWLRLKFLPAMIFIILGKLLRYSLLIFLLSPVIAIGNWFS